jgi:hypothetical protein
MGGKERWIVRVQVWRQGESEASLRRIELQRIVVETGKDAGEG